jgi:hypothetical protein
VHCEEVVSVMGFDYSKIIGLVMSSVFLILNKIFNLFAPSNDMRPAGDFKITRLDLIISV